MGGDAFPGAPFRPTLQPKPEKRHHHVNLSYISDHIISDHIISYIQSCQPLISNLQKRAKGDKLVKTETEPGNSIILSTFPIYRNCTRWQAVWNWRSQAKIYSQETLVEKRRQDYLCLLTKIISNEAIWSVKHHKSAKLLWCHNFAGFKELFGERESFKEVSVFSWESFGHGCCPLVIIWDMVFNYPGPGLDFILSESAPDLGYVKSS